MKNKISIFIAIFIIALFGLFFYSDNSYKLALEAKFYYESKEYEKALNLAKKNALKFNVSEKIEFIKCSYIDEISGDIDILVSNPPYIARGYELSKFVLNEPENALFGGEVGDEILKNQMTVILDEAQLYPTEIIEKIRLMADTRLFKFLFTIHKTKNEDVLAKDYFQTRIWESIELSSADVGEIIIYLQRKLSQKNYDKYLKFDKKDYECAYSFCGGNLRTLNKIMYKFYEICEYYEQYQPSKLNTDKANIMILTMAALDAGLINA